MHLQLVDLILKYEAYIQFAFVYILEAHAIDEWPINEPNVLFPQHKNINDRIDIATKLMADYPLPACVQIYVDNENDYFNNTYSSWPFRYWILHNQRVVLKNIPEGEESDEVSLSQMKSWLQSNCNAVTNDITIIS